jgi:uncharacterized phiE125 gp8 family phage protein
MLTRIQAPAVEPLTVNEAKAHCRVAIISGTVITSMVRSSGIVTATAVAHGLIVGQLALVDCPLDEKFQGIFAVASVPDADTLTWAQAADNATVSGGTVTRATADDINFADYIRSAREEAENFTGIALITQKWRLGMNGFPSCGPIVLPRPPFQQLTLLSYVDSNGTTQTLDSTKYQIDIGGVTTPAQIYPAYQGFWPTVQSRISSVIAEFTCGFGASRTSIDGLVRQAIRKTVSDWYYQRERVGVVPEEAYVLLSTYRNFVA